MKALLAAIDRQVLVLDRLVAIAPDSLISFQRPKLGSHPARNRLKGDNGDRKVVKTPTVPNGEHPEEACKLDKTVGIATLGRS